MSRQDRPPDQMRATWRLAKRFDVEASAASLQAAIGRTITAAWYDYEWGLMLTLDDGSFVIAEGIWHNDSTAGTGAALWTPDETANGGK